MYDRVLDTDWRADIAFDEDDTHTHATLCLRLDDGQTMTTRGDAYRHPRDARQRTVGEEIAAARALIAVGTALLQTASAQIEQTTHHPVQLYR